MTISAMFAPSLALDWNRAWLIPASTNAWFPVKIFKDVALPGIYTVTASTNITVRYNGVFLTPGGETVSFPQSQSQETLEVQVATPGSATLTITFTGTGTATNYNCSTYVNIKAWGVELDAGGVNTGIPELDGINVYAPGSRRTGFANGTNVWQTMVCVTSPQSVDISLPNLGTESGVTRIELTLTEVSQLPGWCVNGRFLSGSQNGDDFSFAAGDGLRTITVTAEAQSNHGNSRQIGVSSARLKLFCKDTGGTCVLTAKPYDGDNVLLGTVTVTVPLDVNNNGITDAWERDKIVEHNGVYPGAPLTWSPALFANTGGDDEPAALGNRRTDGSYSHADTGDGLTVFQEYRGYEVDGGASFTSTRHIRLSPALKELLVQVNELPGMASQPSFNPVALSAYNFSSVMQQVAQFYCHPVRGLGIDLYWCRRDFTAFGEPYIPQGLPPVENSDRFTGETQQIYYDQSMVETTNILDSANAQVVLDNRLITEPFTNSHNRAVYNALRNRPNGYFIKASRDVILNQFVKLVLLDRRANLRVADNIDFAVAVVQPDNALTYFNNTDSTLEGCHICVDGIADEGITFPNIDRFYDSSEFRNVLVWSIAHELCHLLIGAIHFSSATALMTNANTAPLGISTIISESEEIILINLKNRHSIKQGE